MENQERVTASLYTYSSGKTELIQRIPSFVKGKKKGKTCTDEMNSKLIG